MPSVTPSRPARCACDSCIGHGGTAAVIRPDLAPSTLPEYMPVSNPILCPSNLCPSRTLPISTSPNAQP